MFLKYSFTADEIAVLDKARLVFNRFTGQNFDIQQYINYSVKQAIAHEVATAKEIGAMMDAPSIYVDKYLQKGAAYAH